MQKKKEISHFGVCTCSGILEAVGCFVVSHNVFVSPLSLPSVALCVRFVAVRDAEIRRAWRQQQAAFQAQQEGTTRRAGDYTGGSRNAKYYVLKFRIIVGLHVCLFVCYKKTSSRI